MAGRDEDAIDWSLATWEGAEREQLRRWSELTLEEILRAQEEMQDLAERLAQDSSTGAAGSARTCQAPRKGDPETG